MKEASGELSMTLIVIVAAGVILGIFMLFKDPITNAIKTKWGEWTGIDMSPAMIVKSNYFE